MLADGDAAPIRPDILFLNSEAWSCSSVARTGDSWSAFSPPSCQGRRSKADLLSIKQAYTESHFRNAEEENCLPPYRLRAKLGSKSSRRRKGDGPLGIAKKCPAEGSRGHSPSIRFAYLLMPEKKTRQKEN